MAKSFTTEGIILKRQPFGEADRLVTIFSLNRGKITCLAKGIRRPTSRKKGSLEAFCHAKVFIIKGKNLDLLTQAETIQTFSPLAKNLAKHSAASYLCELIDKLTAQGQPNRHLFSLLRDYLHRIAIVQLPNRRQLTASLDQLKLEFSQQILELLGFGLPAKANLYRLQRYIENLTEKKLNSSKFFSRHQIDKAVK